jgi:phosphate-selective porin
MGAQARVGDVVLIAQAMDGSTAFEPRAGLLLDTRFHAGSLLAAWDRGRWRPALRLDLFSLRQLPDTLADPLDEHGNAMTLALNWRPREFLRVTGELLRVDSRRDQRRLEGSSPRQVEVQSQLSLRLEF